MLQIKRMYDEWSKEDGFRVLVDRLWPRGVSKEKAKLDQWFKEIAPSDKLRKDFHHEDEEFKDFEKDYLKELKENDIKEEFLSLIKEKLDLGNVTLLYAAKNETMNNAVVLKEWIEDNL